MGWKSTHELTREEAISLIINNINNLSNEELGDGLTSLGFGDNLKLPHYGMNFSVVNHKQIETEE